MNVGDGKLFRHTSILTNVEPVCNRLSRPTSNQQ
jgi:hypothetical protein